MTQHSRHAQSVLLRRGAGMRGQAAIETAVVTVALVLGVWGVGVWLESPEGGVLALWLHALREAYRDGVAALALPL